MTERVLPAKITRAGLAYAMRAQNAGIKVRLTHFAIGKGRTVGSVASGYTPTGNETSLADEKARYVIGGVEYIAPNEAVLTAYCDGPSELWINEVGFFGDDGTLVAVWSDPLAPLAYKTGNVPVAIAFTIVLTELPVNLVQFIVGAPNVSIIVVSPVANLSRAVAQLQKDAINSDGRAQMEIIRAAVNAI